MKTLSDRFPKTQQDPRTRRYLLPTRAVWSAGDIVGTENLFCQKRQQVTLFRGHTEDCVLTNKPGQPKASLLLDFGTELHGSLRLAVRKASSETSPNNSQNLGSAKIRIRFGESVSEAMCDVGEKNATNDHANRDMVWNVGSYSAMETNESGFRFARIDLLDEDAYLRIKGINAVLIYRDIPYLGSFDCSDPLLNKIWDTAAYTAHLCMQEYLWDGIKRDRLVFSGDVNPEILTINAVFGYNEVVPETMDLDREESPITDDEVKWVNLMPAFSLWWLCNQKAWYDAHADLDYLRKQEAYMTKLLTLLISCVDENGVEQMPGGKFLDWPNNRDEKARHAGSQALLSMALQDGAQMMDILGNSTLADTCRKTALRMKQYVPDCNGSKSAAAMLAEAGLLDAAEANRVIAKNGAHGFTTFLGYYILKAMAMAGNYTGALNAIRQYWGGMLQMGATTFWEDFDIARTENATPIDQIVPEGKADIHGDYGDNCYTKLRHSLCHGWSSGPCPYLARYVLGIQPEAPGCKKIRIAPNLGDLDYAKGTYPTPYGIVSVEHIRQADGTVKSTVSAPKEIEIL